MDTDPSVSVTVKVIVVPDAFLAQAMVAPSTTAVPESGQVVESDVRGIDGGFVEIGVETLFDILNELINKR